MELTDYYQFLENKMDVVEWSGFEIDVSDLHPDTFPHQKDAIRWAARIGRGLIAMSFGLGKTRIAIELAKQVVTRTDGKFLMICPLGVKHQFTEEDGPVLGVKFQYVTSDQDIKTSNTPYLITNYERVRDGNITLTDEDGNNIHNIMGANLDEGSVLRSLGSKTYEIFDKQFKSVPYRWVSTATPSPNRYRELIYYAGFFDIMDKGQALTRFFQRDTSKAGNLTLHPQHEEAFWLWVASWALFIYKPSDLGYSDEGYELPPLNVHWHRISVDHTRAWEQTDSWGQHRLFLDAAAGVREAVAEKRETIPERIRAAKELITDNRHWLIWHHLEDERKAITMAMPESTPVYGSQPLETREQRILDFSHGKIPILATKPEIAGSGCNFQKHCHSNIFLGIDYRFQDFIQAVHRTYRFQQTREVDVHIIYAESEQQIAMTLKKKWKQHDKLVEKMQGIVKKYGLTHWAIETGLKRNVSTFRDEYQGRFFRLVNTDSTVELFNLVEAMENGLTDPFQL